MIKVTKILNIDNFNITCLFNNGVVKIIDVEPLLLNHSHLKGIEKLFNQEIFNQAKVGLLGEILWEKIISTEHNGQAEIWDYDVSPELIMAVGKSNKLNTAV
jgi:Protein of unknown function (DUF2442)